MAASLPLSNKPGTCEIDNSDIGNALRDIVVKRHEGELAARRSAFKDNEKARDAIVSSREGAGEYVEALPEYKTLLSELEGKLLKGAKAKESPTAPVSDPGILRAYETVYDAVRRQRRQVGTNEEGKPIYKEFPVSFKALDDVRRNLGQVFEGDAPEGYKAIGADIARDLYEKISIIQKQFAASAFIWQEGVSFLLVRSDDKIALPTSRKVRYNLRYRNFQTGLSSGPCRATSLVVLQ